MGSLIGRVVMNSLLGQIPAPAVSAGPRPYTSAAGADAKRKLDLKVEGDGIAVDKDSANYWRAYVDKASKGTVTFSTRTTQIQFFMVKDGWEGFMQSGTYTYTYSAPPKAAVTVTHDFGNGDAVLFYNPLADKVESFNANDALVAVRSDAGLKTFEVLGAFQLLIRAGRQDYADKGSVMHDKDGNELKDKEGSPILGQGWDKKDVTIASPRGYRAHDAAGKDIGPGYAGISVKDFDNYFSDIHGYLGSHGCIMVCPLDGNGKYDTKKWNDFAGTYLPGKSEGKTIGTMRLVGY